MNRRLRLALTGPAVLLVLGIGAWTALFALYRVPGGDAAAWSAAAVPGLAALAGVAGIVRRRASWLLPSLALFAAALAAFFLTTASNDRDWADDVSRPVTATFEGDDVVLHDLRDFAWRSDSDFTPRWEERRLPMADLATLDVVNSYWTGPLIAHTLLSFGFGQNRYVTFSVEIRRERTEEYSALAGFFRRYERVTIGADERDILFLRSNVRREDPEIYRVRATPAQVRALFREMLARANALAEHPAWYNSLTANCTTELFGAARVVDPALPLDWRIVLSGFLPDYLYDQGLLDTRVPLPDLKAAARFKERALAAGDGPDFSSAIRAGVPDPNR